jgi:eukaryotic-like serine/threonine-protein kinase
MQMEPERWRDVERLYHQALERPEGERDAFLEGACTGDVELRRAVESLLEVHGEAEAFLEIPAVELAAPALAAAASPDDTWGARLERLRTALADQYVVERELGAGGMARVYLAQDRKHRRHVAMKVLKPEVAAALGADRFLREIETAARLNHPHILPLFDSGGATGLLYYVMPFVEGESLRDRLTREKQLPLEDALQIAREVADALSYAHTLGVVHRDIKPENILLEAGHAVVTDFGIARAITVSGPVKLTPSGVAIGTAPYMSPEQADQSDELDGRSDIYSLGCVLYEMLAGKPPFTGPTMQSIVHQHLAAEPPPVTTIRATVPTTVEAVIHRALAKAPADRFATGGEFAKALDTGGAHRRLLRLALTIVLIGAPLALVAAALFDRFTRPVLDSNVVAVAPFDVFDTKLELWREGLVDYLSRNLGGAGPLRTVSPTVVLRRWRGRADPTAASELGRLTGARVVLFGQLIGVGSDSARLRVTVFDASADRVLAEPERSGAVDRIDRLADSVTMDVLRSLGRTGTGTTLRLPSGGTRSLPALKAFLKGEQLLRRFSLDSAQAAYEEAVRGDSTFALALSRLGLVRGWRGQPGGPLALLAGRFNHGLAPLDSLLILSDSLEAASDDTLDTTYWFHRVRKFTTLEEASRRYPDDPQVWYELGEARFHLGYVVGSTPQQTVEAFDRAIALDSAFAPAYFHPVQLAFERNDTAAARRNINRYLQLTANVSEGAGLRVVARLLDRAEASSRELEAVLDTASANVLFDAWRTVQRWPDSAEVGVRLLRLLAAGHRGVGISADTVRTRYLLATELLFRGHLREARTMVASRFGVPFAELAVIGAIPADSAQQAFDGWLHASNERSVVADPPWVARCYRSFLAAEWWARRRDTVALMSLLHRGDSVARSARSIPRLVDAWADTSLARAALALARRDTTEALRRFLAFPDSLCSGFYAALSPSLAPLKRIRFELLTATGRTRDAASLADRQVTLPLTIAAVVGTLERARAAEVLGDRSGALRAYQFVIAVWRNADPELGAYVAEARAGLNRLAGGRR